MIDKLFMLKDITCSTAKPAPFLALFLLKLEAIACICIHIVESTYSPGWLTQKVALLSPLAEKYSVDKAQHCNIGYQLAHAGAAGSSKASSSHSRLLWQV